jgi:hypothetical protein
MDGKKTAQHRSSWRARGAVALTALVAATGLAAVGAPTAQAVELSPRLAPDLPRCVANGDGTASCTQTFQRSGYVSAADLGTDSPISVTMVGGRGGSAPDGMLGGLGGQVVATADPGKMYFLDIGGNGESASLGGRGGRNGGGSGGAGSNGGPGGGGGGGYTRMVQSADDFTRTSELVGIAPGGGGATTESRGGDAGQPGRGYAYGLIENYHLVDPKGEGQRYCGGNPGTATQGGDGGGRGPYIAGIRWLDACGDASVWVGQDGSRLKGGDAAYGRSCHDKGKTYCLVAPKVSGGGGGGGGVYGGGGGGVPLAGVGAVVFAGSGGGGSGTGAVTPVAKAPSITLTWTVDRGSTATTLALSSTGSDTTRPITATATVRALTARWAEPTVDGRMDFYVDGTLWESVGLERGRVPSTSIVGLSPGLHTIRANFRAGNSEPGRTTSGLSPSVSETLAVIISKTTPTVGLVADSDTPAYGVWNRFVATVPASAGGTVRFLDENDRLLGTAPVVNGVATYDVQPLVRLEPGPHRIRASYSGDGYFTEATSPGWDEYVLPVGSRSAGSNGPVAIPDPGTAESAIPLSFRDGGTTGTVVVTPTIRHSWRGDLVVELVSPTGAVFRVARFDEQDSEDDITGSYAVSAPGQPKNGTWKLRVTDTSPNDRGTIAGWKISL